VPNVTRVGPYRLHFYSNNGIEPVHVHIEAGGRTAKFWIKPVRMEHSKGFNAADLAKIQKIVESHSQTIERKWHEYFSR
jgi:hypothetical protein